MRLDGRAYIDLSSAWMTSLAVRELPSKENRRNLGDLPDPCELYIAPSRPVQPLKSFGWLGHPPAQRQ